MRHRVTALILYFLLAAIIIILVYAIGTNFATRGATEILSAGGGTTKSEVGRASAPNTGSPHSAPDE